ncbi:MAG: B12-binding domain-containing radical SAM protein [Candidatus Omnitrophica bacterium]|nr:B12-binding domain-containing radical SAM protein [Candidatus Omnitrophota bacterium]
MKVLLINPPLQDFFFTPSRNYPLNLIYLGTVLNYGGFKVKILNSLEANKKITLKIPKEFSYLKKYYHQNKSPFCLFSNYYHFGMIYQEIEDVIKDYKPDLVGISSNFSAYFDSAKEVAKITKKIDKRIIVVLGGRFPTAVPEFVLENLNIDFLIRGEAEYSLLKLCKVIAEGKSFKIDGLCYRRNNKIFISKKIPVIENLNTLLYPKRELIDYKKYKFKNEISTSIISSRGCNLSCKFCAIREKFRYRSADNILEEMKYCFSLGIRHFNFEDDNINCNPEFEKLLDLLILNFSGQIKISFMNGLMSFGLKKLLPKLLKANLTHIDFSIVTSNKNLSYKANRKENIKDIFYLSKQLAKHNIKSTVHFIVGLPDQTYKDALADLKILAKNTTFLGPSIFYPVIESPYFIELKKFGISIGDYKFFRSSCAYFDKSLSKDQIFSIFYFARIINFAKELIDKFSLREETFFKFLEKITKKYRIIDNKIISETPIEKTILGIILLNRLLKENKIFYLEEKRQHNNFVYTFKTEDFIDWKKLKKLIKILKIRGFSGRLIKFC